MQIILGNTCIIITVIMTKFIVIIAWLFIFPHTWQPIGMDASTEITPTKKIYQPDSLDGALDGVFVLANSK